MLIEYKNLKDSEKDFVKDSFSMPVMYHSKGSGSYTKTNKLIMALYMVTDIIDIDEPLRNKLRTLGMEIISDIYVTPPMACVKIKQILSFLEIASAVNIISEMNYGILKKEFFQLNKAIKESSGDIMDSLSSSVNLIDFLKDEPGSSEVFPLPKETHKGQGNSKGHLRIGVQKGSTLLKALSDKTRILSDSFHYEFDAIKKQRREDIINIIKNNGGSATIKDIRTKTQNGTNGSVAYGEKTLQRELMSMTKDGVLNKTGEKRWTKYSLLVS